MSLIDLQRGITRLCLEPEASLSAESLPSAPIWLEYRRMVRRRLLAEAKATLPRTHRLAGEERFCQAFERHLAQSPPRTRRFWEVTLCFARSAAADWESDEAAPPALADLARYEAAVWEVADLDDRVEVAPLEFDFDRRPLLSPAMRLLELRFPVHQQGGADAPSEGGVRLCIHRPPSQRGARAWVLNPMTHGLVRLLHHSELSMTEAIQQLSTEQGFRVDEHYLEGLCSVLADFIEGGLLLGSR